jgi:hypothetical protein
MRQLLKPEADRAKPLILRRRAFGHLEPVLDFEIGEMRLDHAEQDAANVVGRDRAAETDARFNSRCRPDIGTGLFRDETGSWRGQANAQSGRGTYIGTRGQGQGHDGGNADQPCARPKSRH